MQKSDITIEDLDESPKTPRYLTKHSISEEKGG